MAAPAREQPGWSTPSTATGRPSRSYTARKLRSAQLPSTTRTSSPSRRQPANWMRTPYWSDQKYGTAGGTGTSLPSSAATAVAGCSSACVQCSVRTGRPRAGDQAAAQSPTATTPGSDVAPRSSVTTPSRRSRPDPASHSTLGRAPMPTTTTSAGSRRPSASSTTCIREVPVRPATPVPVSSRTPCSACSPAQTPPISGPSGPASGTGRLSTTVTSRPRPRAVEATSAPTKPAPMTTRCAPGTRSARRATASSRVRSTWTPAGDAAPSSDSVPGRRRARAPVASTTPSARTSPPSASRTARVAGSRATAVVPSRQSSSSASSSGPLRARASAEAVPARNCLDSGGRS